VRSFVSPLLLSFAFRCGNIRKKNIQCSECPNVYCVKCAEKMFQEFGKDIFLRGCPVVSYFH
jgi:hypothetical protein